MGHFLSVNHKRLPAINRDQLVSGNVIEILRRDRR